MADESLLHGKKILVVDDEPVNQQVLVNHLNQEKYSVKVAANGPDALSLIEKQKFDLQYHRGHRESETKA